MASNRSFVCAFQFRAELNCQLRANWHNNKSSLLLLAFCCFCERNKICSIFLFELTFLANARGFRSAFVNKKHLPMLFKCLKLLIISSLLLLFIEKQQIWKSNLKKKQTIKAKNCKFHAICYTLTHRLLTVCLFRTPWTCDADNYNNHYQTQRAKKASADGQKNYLTPKIFVANKANPSLEHSSAVKSTLQASTHNKLANQQTNWGEVINN